jgi:hypothetical protein
VAGVQLRRRVTRPRHAAPRVCSSGLLLALRRGSAALLARTTIEGAIRRRRRAARWGRRLGRKGTAIAPLVPCARLSLRRHLVELHLSPISQVLLQPKPSTKLAPFVNNRSTKSKRGSGDSSEVRANGWRGTNLWTGDRLQRRVRRREEVVAGGHPRQRLTRPRHAAPRVCSIRLLLALRRGRSALLARTTIEGARRRRRAARWGRRWRRKGTAIAPLVPCARRNLRRHLVELHLPPISQVLLQPKPSTKLAPFVNNRSTISKRGNGDSSEVRAHGWRGTNLRTGDRLQRRVRRREAVVAGEHPRQRLTRPRHAAPRVCSIGLLLALRRGRAALLARTTIEGARRRRRRAARWGRRWRRKGTAIAPLGQRARRGLRRHLVELHLPPIS